MSNHSHYYKDIEHLKTLDVYRVLSLYDVNDPCVQHAIKKLLMPGLRGSKDKEKDIREAVDALNRHLQMIAEDCNKVRKIDSYRDCYDTEHENE